MQMAAGALEFWRVWLTDAALGRRSSPRATLELGIATFKFARAKECWGPQRIAGVFENGRKIIAGTNQGTTWR
jgi:hypothetical protein